MGQVLISGNNAGVTLSTIKAQKGYRTLISTVAKTVSAQPINFLQNLGGGTDAFIYERQPGAIRLLPGVAFCLRRFQPLVNQLARSHWIAHIKRNKLNQPMLGDVDDLDSFLFETPRQALVVIGAGLRKLSNGKCFYCLSTVKVADVDHFIPFSLYPRDLMHNFVLACPACNRSKSDTLAAKMHLDHWLEYTHQNTDDLIEIGEQVGVAGDEAASHAIARWGYQSAVSSQAQAWVSSRQYESVTPDYLCLAGT